LIAAAVLLFVSCSGVYYGAIEKLGYAKRDLMVSRVKAAQKKPAAGQAGVQIRARSIKSVRESARQPAGGQVQRAQEGSWSAARRKPTTCTNGLRPWPM
jgi:hypothetical protein